MQVWCHFDHQEGPGLLFSTLEFYKYAIHTILQICITFKVKSYSSQNVEEVLTFTL